MLSIIAAALGAVVIGGMIAEYRDEKRRMDAADRQLIREEIVREDIRDAIAWRAQLDREQLWRDYMREVEL